jgi:transposase
MEDVLDLYQQPLNPAQPMVCFDERPTQLISEKRQPLPAEPGQRQRYDYEYHREGTANVFAFFQPWVGWRHLKVTAQRTKADFATCMKELVDVHFPHAEVIRLVMDNLNTHNLASLYETFEPAEARRIARKLEIHYTPKHGSWLNMVEIELSVLARQCLDRRISDPTTLEREVTAWEQERNQRQVTVQWQFTSDLARVNLKSLYPSI